MKGRTSLLLAFLAFYFTAAAQPDTVKHRIFLVGDAGEIEFGQHQVIDWLQRNVDWNDERNIILYLGDNIYEYGLPPKSNPDYEHYRSVLDYQISLVKDKKSRAFFVPGNHDWNNGKIGGLARIKNQVNYVKSLELENVEYWPQEGCPGPIEVDLSDSVVLVFFDSQWWLHTHDKPGLESHCESKTQDEVLSVFEEIAETNKHRMMIVAMHHPMYSHGPHGGNYTLRHHLFPLTELNRSLYIPMPIIGSIYPVARGVFGNIQDVKHPTYRTMIKGIENVMKKHGHAIHVAGHDHSLQYLMKDSIPYVVSGSGAKLSRIKPGKWLEYGEVAARGFALIDVYKSGKGYVKFYTTNSVNLQDPDTVFALKPIVQPEREAMVYQRVLPLPDSVTAAGNPKLEGNWLRNFMLGENYRKEWITPIKVKVLDITTESGGLKPTKLGGGKQTRSLRLVDSTGKEYSLRSIKKFPVPAMPVEFRETFVKDLVEDGISASYPYASLSMGPLTRAVGLPFLRSRLFYIPDDTSLGRFREDFANTLCMLEEREPAFISKTYNTEELVVRLMKDNDDHVNQKSVLMSRILDMYIMDFDRHEDQWRWFTTDTGRGKIYNPIPRDRDQAFFVNEGLIPSMMKSKSLIPDIQGFRPKAHNIKTFNKSARNFDRSFLTELDAATWSHMVDSFLLKMSDDVLYDALSQQPPEIRHFHSDEIIRKLQKRRAYLKSDIMEYYRFLSETVSVTGTNQRELFTVENNSDGTMLVRVNKIDKANNISSRIYERKFDPAHTDEVRIFGMDGDDRFDIIGSSKAIRARVVGGYGNDTFQVKGGNGKTIIYDDVDERNVFLGDKTYKDRTSDDEDVNEYNRLSFRYNMFNPGLHFSYNVDEGWYFGLQFQYTTHGFRKDPFATKSRLTLGRAFGSNSYQFKFKGEYTKFFRNKDLVVNADIKAPVNVQNFFGIGNETVFDKSKGEKAYYYRARYNIGDINLYARKNLQSWMNFNYGLGFQFFSMDSSENRGKFIRESYTNGPGNNNVYATKTYLGPAFSLEIDNRNNEVLPTRGTKTTLKGRYLHGLNERSDNLAQVGLDVAIFISMIEETNLVLATRFGANLNIGGYEFFQANYLGAHNNLRGFHNNRFAGKRSYFNNTELRIRLAQFRTYFFPGSFGALVFHDIGRVFVPGTPSERWHTGYGAGLWLSPLRRFVLVASVMRSNETTLPHFSFGFQF